MTIIDERVIAAPADLCFMVAADVERWPDILRHYRHVRFHRKDGFGTGRVEMSAWRDFSGPIRYPTWWVSEMRIDRNEPAIHFTHVDGITRRMDVKWSFLQQHATDRNEPVTHVRITHAWDGPNWPIIGTAAWRLVIAPHFVSFIATRTLAGIAAEVERRLMQRTAIENQPARQEVRHG